MVPAAVITGKGGFVIVVGLFVVSGGDVCVASGVFLVEVSVGVDGVVSDTLVTDTVVVVCGDGATVSGVCSMEVGVGGDGVVSDAVVTDVVVIVGGDGDVVDAKVGIVVDATGVVGCGMTDKRGRQKKHPLITMQQKTSSVLISISNLYSWGGRVTDHNVKFNCIFLEKKNTCNKLCT